MLSLLSTTTAQTLEAETCDSTRMMVDVDFAQADAVIGGIFDMRQPGSDGYGCSEPHPGKHNLFITSASYKRG